MVAYAKSFCDDIEFSAEDASRSDRAFLAQCYTNAVAAGATTLNVPDTVGYSTPQEMAELITYLKEHVEGIENTDISVHCHDDLGMAVANTLACIKAGATQVECTVNGIGERAGNASWRNRMASTPGGTSTRPKPASIPGRFTIPASS